MPLLVPVGWANQLLPVHSSSVPFSPTARQKVLLVQVTARMNAPVPMSRLLQLLPSHRLAAYGPTAMQKVVVEHDTPYSDWLDP
jgi:hypothetical protein